MLSLLVNYSLYWSIYRRPDMVLAYSTKTPNNSVLFITAPTNFVKLLFFCRVYYLLQIISVLKVLFFVVGQMFNLAVYYKLGNKGVYYGRELGVKNLPIVTTFPYNVLSYHPQYIGSLMSMISFMITFYSPALCNYCLTWCGLISTTMMLE